MVQNSQEMMNVRLNLSEQQILLTYCKRNAVAAVLHDREGELTSRLASQAGALLLAYPFSDTSDLEKLQLYLQGASDTIIHYSPATRALTALPDDLLDFVYVSDYQEFCSYPDMLYLIKMKLKHKGIVCGTNFEQLSKYIVPAFGEPDVVTDSLGKIWVKGVYKG